MTRHLAASLSLIALAIAGCTQPNPGDEAAPPSIEDLDVPRLDRYAYHGTACRELGLDVIVPASNVRPHVPSQYRFTLESQGRAVLSFAFARCDQMVPQNATQPLQVVHVDVAVQIQHPSGSGTAMYELAWPVNHAGMAANASRVGFPAAYAPTLTMLEYALRAGEQIQIHVRAPRIVLDVEALGARALTTGAVGGTYFHSDANGTSRMVYDVQLASVGAARGTIRTSGDGLIPSLLGGASADASGFYGTFRLGANLTRIPAR